MADLAEMIGDFPSMGIQASSLQAIAMDAISWGHLQMPPKLPVRVNIQCQPLSFWEKPLLSGGWNAFAGSWQPAACPRQGWSIGSPGGYPPLGSSRE